MCMFNLDLSRKPAGVAPASVAPVSVAKESTLAAHEAWHRGPAGPSGASRWRHWVLAGVLATLLVACGTSTDEDTSQIESVKLGGTETGGPGEEQRRGNAR